MRRIPFLKVLILTFCLILLTIDAFSEESKKDIDMAISLYKSGQYSEAISAFEAILSKDTNSPCKEDILFYMAQSLFALNEWPACIDILKGIQGKNPGNALRDEDISYRLMLAYFALGDWNLALDEADNFLSHFPGGKLRNDVLYLKSWVFFRSGSPEKALEFLFSIPDIAPLIEQPESIDLILADEAWIVKDFGESVKYFSRIFDKTMGGNNDDYIYDEYTRWIGMIKYADSLWHSWRFSEAVKIYKRIEEGNAPVDIKCLSKLQKGLGFFDCGCYKNAGNIFSSALTSGFDCLFSDFLFALKARSLSLSADWSQAEEVFKHVLEITDDDNTKEEAYWGLIKGFYNRCDFSKAIDYSKTFITQYPNSVFVSEAAYLMGWSYIYLEEFDNAEETFQYLLKQGHEGELLSQTLFSLGMIYLRGAKTSESNKMFSNMLTKPEAPKTLRNKAYFLLALGTFRTRKYNTARQLLEKSLLDKDTGKDVLLPLARVFQSIGDYQKANNLMEEFLNNHINKHNTYLIKLTLLWQLAKNSYIMGDYQGAIDRINLILSNGLESPYHKCARALMLKSMLYMNDSKGFLANYFPFLGHNPMINIDGGLVSEDKYIDDKMNKTDKLKEISVIYSGTPKEFTALLKLGNLQVSEGSYKSALATYNHLLSRYREKGFWENAHLEMGILLYKMKDYITSTQHLAIVLSSDNVEFRVRSHYFLGLNYKSLGRKDLAREKFQGLLANNQFQYLQPNDLVNIGLFFEEERVYNNAIKAFQFIIKSEKSNFKIKAEAQYWIGECFYNIGDFKRARSEFLKVVDYYPRADIWRATALVKAAEACSEIGAFEEALRLYKKVAEDDEGSKYGSFSYKKAKEMELLIKKKNKEKGR